MKKKLIVLLSLVMVISLLASCGGTGSGESGEKELVAAIEAAPSVLDMHGTSSQLDAYGLMQVYDTLLMKDEKGEITGSLAKDWEISDDGMVYTFHLNEGVKFTNGDELKASDVAFSLNRAKESSYSSYNFSNMDKSKALDDYTVEVSLNSPNVSFLETLTGFNACIASEAVVSQYGDDFGKTAESVIGTGAYKLTEWTPGQKCAFEANEDYFKGAAPIKKFRMKAYSDTNSAIIALQTGEIQYYFADIPGISIETVEKEEKLTLTSFDSRKCFYLSMNNESGIFADKRMRQAVAYAADRNKIMTAGVDGIGTITNTLAGPDYAGVPAVDSWYENDIEKAKQLVKESGNEGAKVVIKCYSIGSYAKLATALQEDLNKIGLKAEILQEETDAMIADLEDGNFEIAVTGWNNSTKDTGDIFTIVLDSKNAGGTNDARYKNDRVDELLIAGAKEEDSEKRAAIYKEIAEIVNEDVPYIPLFYTKANRAYASDLKVAEGNVQYDKIYNYSWK